MTQMRCYGTSFRFSAACRATGLLLVLLVVVLLLLLLLVLLWRRRER